MKNYAIVLAAGKGTRMKTDLPKAAYPLLKRPMIKYVLNALDNSTVDENIVVVGHKKEVFEEMLGDTVKYAYQKEQLGTGHAVMQAINHLEDEEGSVVITCGDMPLISTKIIDYLISNHIESKEDITVVSTTISSPTGYGRIVRGQNGRLEAIVEEKDADPAVKLITEINTGLYCVKTKVLKELLCKLKPNNAQKEYYLTDIIKLGRKHGYVVDALHYDNHDYFIGVNTLYDLSIAALKLKMRTNKKHMLNGVSIIDPSTVTIADEAIVEPGAEIHPNTYITGSTYIGKGCVIGPNTEIHNSKIGANTVVRHSLVTDCEIGKNTTVGPFAHLRNGAVLGDKMRIGNFVEIKNSQIDDGTKISHLTYVGDTTCGKKVNFGCGSVTVNYDGVNKHRTTIGDNVFLGCNVNLIAPVKVGSNTFVAAGSTITDDIPDEAFTIARNRQITKEHYKIKRKEKED